jgi:hypothetical protein
MQLIIDIKDDSIIDKVKNLLSTLKDEDIQIKEIKSTNIEQNLTDGYIEENWQEVVSEALKTYDSNYEKSFQYKIDRANFQQMKENL